MQRPRWNWQYRRLPDALIRELQIMSRTSGGFPARTAVAGFVVAWVMAVGVAASGSPPLLVDEGQAVRSATATTSLRQTTGLVGDSTCLTCHEGQDLQASAHARAQNPRTPAATGQSCETCHGPGQAHVDTGDETKINRFAALSPGDANAACVACHNRGEHANWQGSMHDARNVSCVSCHSVHAPKSEKASLKVASASASCESCHRNEAMKVQRAGHMPVREGKMECTTCHTPHGSNNVRMLRAGNSINESCASCHAEKRGPFVWEHAAGRENCVSCHDPHGSNNDRMLVAKSPMLCQRCHVSSRHPATIYDGTQLASASNRMVGRSCVNCHSQIHGSNHPAGNFFIR
jgi:DmsE family decaheme c-type cytochrome